MSDLSCWDLVVVGAGPAGSAAALAALDHTPGLRVLLLDRDDFPRDKSCGDGIAPHVLEVLHGVGVRGLLDDWTPVAGLRLEQGCCSVRRQMARPAFVVPRKVFDERLVRRAVAAGAQLRRHRVRTVQVTPDAVILDDTIRAAVVVGADGAHSVIRRALGVHPVRRRALAIRGYAPTPTGRQGQQMIVFGESGRPSYAWSFDRGDGWCNVGYGEVRRPGRPAPTRDGLLARLEELLPGAGRGGEHWLGHQLPLSSWRWGQPGGRVLLSGDAAGLVNPMTGEGIYYAVLTGALAGHAAAEAAGGVDAANAASRYQRRVRSELSRHLPYTATLSRLLTWSPVVASGLAAAAENQAVFDDLVEIGLGRGQVTPRLLGGVLRQLAGTASPRLGR